MLSIFFGLVLGQLRCRKCCSWSNALFYSKMQGGMLPQNCFSFLGIFDADQPYQWSSLRLASFFKTYRPQAHAIKTTAFKAFLTAHRQRQKDNHSTFIVVNPSNHHQIMVKYSPNLGLMSGVAMTFLHLADRWCIQAMHLKMGYSMLMPWFVISIISQW